VRVESFPPGEEPTQTCPIHTQPPPVPLRVCADSGDLPTPYCPNVVRQSFPQGTEPTQRCTLHTGKEARTDPSGSSPTPPGATANPPDDNTTRLTVCTVSGNIATERCPNTQEKVFPAGQEPLSLCRVH
jgi:hypothetical protein